MCARGDGDLWDQGEGLSGEGAGFAQDVADGCTIAVRVHPGAKRDAVTRLHAGALKIALTTPPVDGRANEALIGFAAERLGVPKARVRLIAGAASRSKVLRVEGRSATEVRAALSPEIAC